MINSIIHSIIKNKYRLPKYSLYSNKMITDYSPSSLFVINPKNILESNYFFEPDDCLIKKLLVDSWHDFSREFDSLIKDIMKDLLIYGKAYIIIKAFNNKNKTTKIELEETQGVFLKRFGRKWSFWSLEFGGRIKKSIIQSDEIIIFSLDEIGYHNNFKKMFKTLQKYDAFSNNLISNSETFSYDFVVHSNYNKQKVFQKTKEIGWIFGTENLSESNILYRRIQKEQFKEKVLNYIICKINDSLSTYLHNPNTGRIKANTTNIEYEKVWNDYKRGQITSKELGGLLYRH